MTHVKIFCILISSSCSSYWHTQRTDFLLIQDGHNKALPFEISIEVPREATSFFGTTDIQDYHE